MSNEASDRPLVLVVDDEPSNLQLMKRILERDYRLSFAKDGLRAFELAVSEQPDIILLDVMMPGMTGHDVCRRLKSRAETARIPVIFVTALSDPEDEVTGFEIGAVDYAIKLTASLVFFVPAYGALLKFIVRLLATRNAPLVPVQ